MSGRFGPWRARAASARALLVSVGRPRINPPVLMVLAALLVLVSMAGYRAGDLDTIPSAAQFVTTARTETPDGRTLLVSVMDPAQRAARQALLAETRSARGTFADARQATLGPVAPAPAGHAAPSKPKAIAQAEPTESNTVMAATTRPPQPLARDATSADAVLAAPASAETRGARSRLATAGERSRIVGPQIPEAILVARSRVPTIPDRPAGSDPTAEQAIGPEIPEPILLARLREELRTNERAADPARGSRGQRNATNAGSAARETDLADAERMNAPADPPALLAVGSENRADEAFVGPPAPPPAVLLARAAPTTDEAPAVVTAAAELEDFVGPPLPPGFHPDASLDDADVVAGEDAVVEARPGRDGTDDDAYEPEFEEILPVALSEGVHTVGYLRALRHRFRWGETMSQVLGRVGIHPRQIDEWIRATNDQYDVDRVYAGQELEILLAMPTSELQRLRMEIDPQTVLVVERHEGRLVARREQITYERTLRVVGGAINHSLYVTAQSQGVPDKIISDMAEILGWDVNFASEITPGATYRVVYEELTRPDTMETIPGRLLAVDLANRGRRYEGFFFTLPDGSYAGYYDREGEGIGRSFLRYPVAFSRISSNFSTARFHPILKRNVPHYGVDFAAPTGTPVKAVADGRVLKAGWYGGNGKFVKIRHDRVYETGYSHLSRIPSNIRPGAWVKKGQTIGYVGSTGLATGPHLHFAMYRNGRYIDPLKADLPRSQSLAGKALAAFRMTVDMIDRAYANAGKGELATYVADAGGAPSSAGGGGQ